MHWRNAPSIEGTWRHKYFHPLLNKLVSMAFTSYFLRSLCRHIENWTGLQILKDVDMELYTGLQRL